MLVMMRVRLVVTLRVNDLVARVGFLHKKYRRYEAVGYRQKAIAF